MGVHVSCRSLQGTSTTGHMIHLDYKLGSAKDARVAFMFSSFRRLFPLRACRVACGLTRRNQRLALQEDGEADEFDKMFEYKANRRRKSNISHAETKSFVEAFLGKMELAADQDVEANQMSRPAIHKLQVTSPRGTRSPFDALASGGSFGDGIHDTRRNLGLRVPTP